MGSQTGSGCRMMDWTVSTSVTSGMPQGSWVSNSGSSVSSLDLLVSSSDWLVSNSGS